MPLAGALVKAWRSDLAANGSPLDVSTRDSLAVAWESHSDARGEFTLPCARAGEWMVSVVHMTPCRESEVADWESTWGSLTFERADVDAKGSQ